MQIIYSALRKLIVINSVSQFQALQLLTPFFRLQRALLIVLKSCANIFKILFSTQLIFLYEYVTIYQYRHETLDLRRVFLLCF